MKIIWRKKASDELASIYNYISIDSPQNALMVFDKIYELVNSLLLFPERNPVDRAINNPNVRSASIWDFKIIYSIEKDAIVILRIFGTKQNPNKLKF